MSISVVNPGLQPYGQYSFSAAGDVTTSPSLFPYASGYTVFAGNCTDNNPLGKDNNKNLFYPTAAPVPIAVPPGGSAATTVPLYNVAIHVQNATAVPVQRHGADRGGDHDVRRSVRGGVHDGNGKRVRADARARDAERDRRQRDRTALGTLDAEGHV